MRGKQAKKRPVSPDKKYSSVVVGKFINVIMDAGKKRTAERVVYEALDILEQKSKKPALEAFEEALKNISPVIEVRGRRIGGANYQIPTPVRGGRKQALGFRWLIEAAKGRKGSSMANRLASELIDARQNAGSAVKKKEDVYRMAEANRAFAHFAR